MVSKFSLRLNPEYANLVLDDNVTYFEDLIYAGFRVNVMDIISLKAQLGKAFHIQPSEIDRMPFWELELYVKELERLIKEENEAQKKEMDKSGIREAKKMTNPNYFSKMMSSSMPKMPDMGSFKMPSIPSSF